MLEGSTAINRLRTMEWLGSEGGDSVYRDGNGTLWEWRNEDGAQVEPKLTEIAAEEAESKYGVG